MTRKFKLFNLDGHPVRGFVADDGTPWVIAKDVAAPLEITEGGLRNTVSCLPAAYKITLEGDEVGNAEKLLTKRKLQGKNDTSKRTLEARGKPSKRGLHAKRLTVVSEAGLNRIIARSDAALREGTFAFRYVEWITSEVLPSLRRDGVYVMTAQAKALVQGLPGWAEVRAEGKVVRRTLTDAVKDLADYAKTQGANEDKYRWLFKNYTWLAYKLAFGEDRAPPGGRDTMTGRQLLLVEVIEDRIIELIDEARQGEVAWESIYRSVKERGEALFSIKRAA